MSGEAQRLIAYFRDCLTEDGGERQINDVLGSNERGQYFFPLNPPAEALDERIALPAEVAERLLAEQHLQQQERQLMAGLFMVSGALPARGSRPAYIRAPLLVGDAAIERQGETFFLSLEQGALRFNSAVLDALAPTLALVEELVDPESVTPEWVGRILDALEQRPHPDTAKGFTRPRRGSPLRWMPSALIWLTARSQLERSVAHELDQMSQPQLSLSPPVRQILNMPAKRPARIRPAEPDTLPASLTFAQQRTLDNAAREVLSVINGPPGTGKTYTLACLAVDRVMRDESVLIVCSNEHAADVVRSKLDALFGDAGELILRAGRGDHRRQLLERLDYWLAGEARLAQGARKPSLLRRMKHATRAYRKSEEAFRRGLARAERAGGGRMGKGIWHRAWRWWARRRLLGDALLADQWDGLQAAIVAHQDLARRTLQAGAEDNLGSLLRERRGELSALTRALRSRSGLRRRDRFEQLDWSLLTRTFPVWVVSAHALSRVLPVDRALFDLVVIDEATQCNLALALPALQRAERAAVVGDPRQLRHFSFLGRARQQVLAERHGVGGSACELDYRSHSLLDYALDAVRTQGAIAFLDEHFRSHPQLIGFSNREFYGGQLKVLTHLENRNAASPLRVESCALELAGTVNQGEVRAVMNRLQSLIRACSHLPDDQCPQIGVVALSRALAETLENRLLASFDLPTLGRHNLRVGTPYAFQGEERDVILMATGVYPGRSSAAWRYLNRPDVFNVAVTRARHQQWVFITEGALEQQPHSLLARYLAEAKRASEDRIGQQAVRAVDNMRRELVSELESWGAHCQLDYEFAGQSLDLLVHREQHTLAIDVIGAPGADAWHWERYRLLERAGLALFPLSDSAWYQRRDAVLAALHNRLGLGGGEARALARPYHALRWRLETLDERRPLALLNDLEQTYDQVVHWLEQRFQPGELTYQRYRGSVERLHRAALAELEGACVLLEGVRELGDTIDASIDQRLGKCRESVAALQLLTGELALLRTDGNALQDALEDVVKLAERVSLYEAP